MNAIAPRRAAQEAERAAVDLTTPDSGRTLLKTFFRLAEVWKLNVPTQMALLGLRNRSTFYAWRALEGGAPNPPNRALSPDTLERLSYLLGIYKALQVLLPEPAAADTWIHRPNSAPQFNGQTPVDRMRAGLVADLLAVRQYLDAARGGWN
jgi:hypothetical protein